MRRRIVCILFVLAVLTGSAVQAGAAENTGSIRVSLHIGYNPVTDGEVVLYRVGDKISDGYRIADIFGGGIVREEDAVSVHLAQWLAQSAGYGGTERLLDAEGTAEFTNLQPGLYLLVQKSTAPGYYPFRPFLIRLPSDGQWNIQAYPKLQRVETESPKTGQDPLPFLGAAGMVISGLGLLLCVAAGRKKR